LIKGQESQASIGLAFPVIYEELKKNIAPKTVDNHPWRIGVCAGADGLF
jgi:hypothetical protein